MRAYEFEVQGLSGPVLITINHDDDGEYVSTDINGFDHDYEMLMSSMGEPESQASLLCEILEFDQGMRVDFAEGIRATPSLSDTSRAIVILSIPLEQRETAITSIYNSNYYSGNMGIRNNEGFMLMLIGSLVDQNAMVRMISGRPALNYGPNYRVFFEIFKTLDDNYKLLAVSQLSMHRFGISDILEIAENSDDAVKSAIVNKMAKHSDDVRIYPANIPGSAKLQISSVVLQIVNIIEKIEDDETRVRCIGTLLMYAHGDMKPRQGERLANMLLSVDPELLCSEQAHILMYNRSFSSSQIGRLYTLLRKCPG